MSLIRNQQDFGAGILCSTLGAAGFGWSFFYPMGTLLRMGPGYFPALVFGLLALFGIAILARALRCPGEGLERWAWRPLVVVLVSVLIFGLLVETVGFIVASVLLVAIACLAGARLKPLQVFVLAGSLTMFCLFIFVFALGLPMPIWPDLL